MDGLYRLALAVPKLKVGAVSDNVNEIKRIYESALHDAGVICFPELSLTGYTCGDLFQSEVLLESVLVGLQQLREATAGHQTVMIVGAPICFADRCFNTAVVMHSGRILGVVPKSFLPNYREFYEKRWFSSGKKLINQMVQIGDELVPIGVDLLFTCQNEFSFGVEICEDLWAVEPPSNKLARAGAEVIFNLSASNEVIGKADFRRQLIMSQCTRSYVCYAYVSSGPSESSTDMVFNGHRFVAESSQILLDKACSSMETEVDTVEVDVFRLKQLRRLESSFVDEPIPVIRRIDVSKISPCDLRDKVYTCSPFVPEDPTLLSQRCREIVELQSLALAQRCLHTKTKGLVIGVSGGLDSCLALLVCQRTQQIVGSKLKIYAVSMPGFATSVLTRSNAQRLCELLGVHFREIDITEACKLHFQAIGHDGVTQDVVYENTQARERTKILMNLSNQVQGMVVGTGDLSEIALGWSTYNGDHMSMYNVNCGVPKTLVRHLVAWIAKEAKNAELKTVLQEILDTPISPELKSDGDGKVAQKTEDIIGPYSVHDFFLYHLLRYGAGPRRILKLAQHAFLGKYSSEQLTSWLRIFINRFFANQFKRNCSPDGPKVGTISLSPRSDWRMPSDASAADWIGELEG